jgi:hypothetical protein
LRHRLSILLGLGAIALTGCSTLESSPSLAAATTLGKLVADSNAERPLHVIFVHGMAAEGAGNSGDLQSALRRFMNVTQTAPAQKTMLDIGPPPGPGEFGFDVWDGDTRKWKRSRPFVLRSVYRSGGKVVVFDEVNWWPLLFPIKCRRLLIPEAQLTGPDKDRLRLCAKGSKEDESSHYFPWIEESDLSRVLDTRPRMEPAPMNAAVKSGVITWGLSDATLALGPLRMRIRTAMDAAFQQAMEVSELDRSARDATRDQQFVVISESLGSFAVLDTFQNPTGSESGGVREVLNRTGFLYFFANQFALLELGRSDAGAQIDALSTTSAASLLEAWSQVKATVLDKDAKPAARQIVAYSDPSDLLTFDVPDLLGVDVYNVSVRNATRWLGLFAWPAKAHTGHASNPAVLKSMFGSVRGRPTIALDAPNTQSDSKAACCTGVSPLGDFRGRSSLYSLCKASIGPLYGQVA